MKRVLIAALVAGGIVVGVNAAVAGGRVGDPHNPPPLPPWIDPSGRVVGMPEWVPVADGGWVRSADLNQPRTVPVPVYDVPNGRMIRDLNQGEGK